MYSNKLSLFLVVIITSLSLIGCGAKTKKLTPLDMGIQNFEAQEYDTAKTLFETVLTTEESNHQALYYLGRIAQQNGDLDGSVGHLEKAISLSDTISSYHFMLGVVYAQKVQKGDVQQAPKILSEFEKAVELDGNNLEARMGLTQYYLNAPPFMGGSETKAKEQIDTIKSINPIKGHLFMAQVNVAKKKYDEAEQEFDAAIKLDPDDPDIYYQQAMMHQTAENYPAAFEALEKSLVIDPVYMNATTSSTVCIHRRIIATGQAD